MKAQIWELDSIYEKGCSVIVAGGLTAAAYLVQNIGYGFPTVPVDIAAISICEKVFEDPTLLCQVDCACLGDIDSRLMHTAGSVLLHEYVVSTYSLIVIHDLGWVIPHVRYTLTNFEMISALEALNTVCPRLHRPNPRQGKGGAGSTVHLGLPARLERSTTTRTTKWIFGVERNAVAAARQRRCMQ